MKQTLIIALAIGMMAACKKESPEPQKPCNCGLITSDDSKDYSVIIRNDCTGNSKKFYLTEGDWVNAHPGDKLCITGESKW